MHAVPVHGGNFNAEADFVSDEGSGDACWRSSTTGSNEELPRCPAALVTAASTTMCVPAHGRQGNAAIQSAAMSAPGRKATDFRCERRRSRSSTPTGISPSTPYPSILIRNWTIGGNPTVGNYANFFMYQYGGQTAGGKCRYDATSTGQQRRRFLRSIQ